MSGRRGAVIFNDAQIIHISQGT